jgi:hypothetical protein
VHTVLVAPVRFVVGVVWCAASAELVLASEMALNLSSSTGLIDWSSSSTGDVPSNSTGTGIDHPSYRLFFISSAACLVLSVVATFLGFCKCCGGGGGSSDGGRASYGRDQYKSKRQKDLDKGLLEDIADLQAEAAALGGTRQKSAAAESADEIRRKYGRPVTGSTSGGRSTSITRAPERAMSEVPEPTGDTYLGCCSHLDKIGTVIGIDVQHYFQFQIWTAKIYGVLALIGCTSPAPLCPAISARCAPVCVC